MGKEDYLYISYYVRGVYVPMSTHEHLDMSFEYIHRFIQTTPLTLFD